ncbi:MAG TPA: GNAT family N-acetyltransferase [Candidatus Dormibacteraeota bacterium]
MAAERGGGPGLTTVRDAEPADAAGVAALLRELGYPTSPAETARRLARGGERVLVAESPAGPGGVVGLAALTIGWQLPHARPLARVTALVVATAARGGGVGRALMARAEALAAEAGCDGVELTSALRPERAAAHRLYESLGYERTSARFWRPLPSPPEPTALPPPVGEGRGGGTGGGEGEGG